MARLVALVVAAVLSFVAVSCGGLGRGDVDRGAYVKANERLFAELPSIPGAHLRSETSTPYRTSDGDPVVGYSTRFDLKLPASASARGVSSLFRQRLEPQWRLVETLSGAVFNFRRGEASVSVNLENAHIHALEIGVDHAYYGKLGR